VRGTPDGYAPVRSRSCHGFVTWASTHAVGAPSVPACGAFNDACDAVQERLDFRDQRLFRKNSGALRGIGGEQNTGKFQRPSRRSRTGEPRQSADLSQLQATDVPDPIFLVRHNSNWKVVSKPRFVLFKSPGSVDALNLYQLPARLKGSVPMDPKFLVT
jgi:hypothetical protein